MRIVPQIIETCGECSNGTYIRAGGRFVCLAQEAAIAVVVDPDKPPPKGCPLPDAFKRCIKMIRESVKGGGEK